MVKNNSDCKIGNLLPPHGLLLPISSKGSFICTIPDFVKPVMEHWLKLEFNGSTMKDWSDDPTYHERTLLPWSYISLQFMFRYKFINTHVQYYHERILGFFVCLFVCFIWVCFVFVGGVFCCYCDWLFGVVFFCFLFLLLGYYSV